MNDIISGSYWTQAYCEKEKLDYEEQNESFFDLLQAAISAHCGEKIALYIHGDPVDSEFEEIELQDLMPIEKVILDSEKVAPRSMLDFLWVNEVILGGNIRSIASGAFAQRRSPYIPRLKAINVIDPQEEGYYSHDGVLLYRDSVHDKLVKFPPGKMLSSYTIPGKEKRLMLINGDAFEDAFFLNEIVIECPCLIPPDAFAHAPYLRRVVFRGNGVMSSFLEDDFVNDLEGDYDIVVPMNARGIIRYAHTHGGHLLFSE